MVLPFFFPLRGFRWRVRKETKNAAGKEVLRLIQIRLATPSLEKTRQPVKPIRRKREIADSFTPHSNEKVI
jgi:hypothetical protein